MQSRDFNIDTQIDNFLAAKKSARRSPKTIKTYAQALGQFRKWFIEEKRSKFDDETVTDYFSWISQEKFAWDDHPTSPTQKRHISNRGLNNVIRIMRVFGNWLASERVIVESPVDNIAYLSEDNNSFTIFTDDDVERLLAVPEHRVFTQYRDYCMMLLLVDTGMRVGELTQLRVKYFEFNVNQVFVPKEISKSKFDRTIPISHLTSKALQNYIEMIGIGSEDYMWLTQFGERYYADTFAKMLKKYGRRAGIDDARVSPHTFRNYFAVKYLKNGGDPSSLMRILGHTSYTMTDRYVKYSKNDLHEQHEKYSPVNTMIDKGNARKRGRLKYR
jgi:integrase/recombinase XerD